ncbi:dihydrodipicolinate synthase family protein [Brenneria goodwinii]|uniref:dihydrodipicolinate synthase family protein n=1 Tax=Brenneria goodwinii TaxID=1109412 RepID=UPI0036ECFA63
MQHRINRHTAGVFAIAPTPFDQQERIDYPSLSRLIALYQQAQVSGITVLGMMGEAQKLSQAEQLSVIDAFLDGVAGALPVIAGVSAAGIANMAALAEAAMARGCAGVMVAPAAGLKTDEAVFNYMKQACTALGPDIPICFQDFPQMTGVHVSADLIVRLTRELPQIVMLKHEDSPGLNKISAIRRQLAADDTALSILTGNGGLYLPLELQRGADGAMTGYAWPEMLVEVVRRHQQGDMDGAQDLFDSHLPLLSYEQQPGIGLAIRKGILRQRGIFASARLRAPGARLSPEDEQQLQRLMQRLAARLRHTG